MKTVKNFTLLLLVLLVNPLLAQKTSLSMRLGAGHLIRQDLIFSPFHHSDVSLMNGALRLERQSPKLYQWVDLGASVYNPSTVPSYSYGDNDRTYPHNFLFVNLAYAVGKEVKTLKPEAKWMLGGLFEMDLQSSTYNYGRVSSFGYFIAFNLGAWARYKHTLANRHTLTTTVTLPLLSWIARSPYLVNDDEFIENIASHKGLKTFLAFVGDGQLQGINKVQQSELHVQYTYQLSKKWSVGAQYEFHLLNTQKPVSLTQMRNLLQAHATLTF